MSKSVLAIDTPEDCMRCLFLTGSDECMLQDENTNFNADTLDELIQTCPLKLLPEKKNMTVPVSNYEVQKNLLAEDWNACIDEITGGE